MPEPTCFEGLDGLNANRLSGSDTVFVNGYYYDPDRCGVGIELTIGQAVGLYNSLARALGLR